MPITRILVLCLLCAPALALAKADESPFAVSALWGEELVASADAAVYVAKSAGRNQVHVAMPVAALEFAESDRGVMVVQPDRQTRRGHHEQTGILQLDACG